MVTVTRDNFLEHSNDLIRHLPSAAFVALDEEMTGITLPSSVACKPRKDETAQQRYQTHLKPVAERYSIVQLGICLFHQHSDYDPINNPRSPEFIVRRYNFFMFPSGESYHGKSVPPPSREVVLNPSSIAFLIQHRMDFSTWMQAGIPYALETQAHEYIHAYLKARQRDLQQQQQQNQDVGCSVSVATGAGQPHQNAATSNTNNAASTSSSTSSGRIELHRTEDIQFFARTMASLREWLDAAHSQSPHLQHRQRHGATHRGVAGVDDNVDDAVAAPAEVAHDPADEDGILEPHGPEVLNQEHHHHNEAGLVEPSLLDGTSFLLPPCNSFLRRALYENIHLEYPALMLESAGPNHPNQIRVWRLNEEERVQRQEQLEREAWEKLIVDKLGMWRIFHALSNANRGIREEHSVASAVSWTTVSATTPTTSATTCGHYQVPIVVHNGLMDILFLMTHFVQWQLPSSYVEFKQLVHSHFPLVYDTKLMSTECCSSNTLFNGAAGAGAAAMPANIHNNNVNNHINEDDGNMANPNNSNHTPASSTVLANLYNKVIVRPGMGFKFQFAPDVARSVYYPEPEHYQPHQEETEHLHQASYDAYMTGAVFVGLCQAIIQERDYVYDETLSGVLSEQQVGSLRFLLSPQPSGIDRSPVAMAEVDDQIKWLFGRNKLYSMMAMFTVDLERLEYGSVDPLRRGMSITSTFRVSGIDPSVATRDVVRCLSHLTDSQGRQVNFEIVWVDDTTFMVAASYLPKTLLKPSDDIVNEHGQIVLNRLCHRFTKETILTLDENWQDLQLRQEQQDVDVGRNSQFAAVSNSWWSRLWNATSQMFGVGETKEDSKKRKQSSGYGSIDAPAAKRNRVD